MIQFRAGMLWMVIGLIAWNVRAGESWTQFRGPESRGVLVGSEPPVRIDPARPTWAIEVPSGQSSPIVGHGMVILTGVEGDRLVTLAIDAETGELRWRATAPECTLEEVHESSSPAAATPCMDDDRVYVYFGSYGVLCYDLDGKEVWRKPLETPRSLYGASASPILHDSKLILVLDDDANLPNSRLSRSRILVLNKADGEMIWETPRPTQRSAWSTPIVWSHAGGEELVVLGSGRLCGYDLASGAEKWRINGFSRETIAQPFVGDGVVFASASMIGGVADDQPDLEIYWKAILHFDANGDQKLQREEMVEPFTFPFRPELPPDHPGFGLPLPSDPQRRAERLDGIFRSTDRDRDGYWTKDEFLGSLSFNRGKPNLLAVRPGGEGDITDTHVAWSLHRGIGEVPTPVLFEGRIYMVADGGILSVIDAADGRIVYRQRLGAIGHYRASPVVAGGHLYVLSQPGVLSVVKCGDAFELVHQMDLKQTVAATPALDAKTIYLRTDRKLMAFRR